MTPIVPVGTPTDEQVVVALEGALTGHRRSGDARRVRSLSRTPYEYATSCQIEDVRVVLNDATVLELLVKHVAPDRMHPDARRVRPPWIHDARRELETYRTILGPAGIGPRCYAAVVDDLGRHWLLLEKVPGVPLWQIGHIETWKCVARWVARFHRRFAPRTSLLRRANPRLLNHSGATFHEWARRAASSTSRLGASDGQWRDLLTIVAKYGQVVDHLCSLTVTFVHGELYPANVIVSGAGRDPAVWPVDWELAGLGPALLDVAALTAGWGPSVQDEIVAAYLEDCGTSIAATQSEIGASLDACRLHYAMQWLGWSDDWQPPPEHRLDWLAVALAAGARLGLLEPVVPEERIG